VQDLDDIRRFLRSAFGWDADDIDEVGKGAWSTAYRFAGEDRDLVIRIGAHVEDFDADHAAAAYRSPLLPIPEVLHVGPFGDEYCCVSTFAAGSPLESCSATEWRAVVPSLVDSLEAMRACGPDRPVRPWGDMLLAVDDDHVGTRLAGWRDRIVRSPPAVDALTSVMTELRTINRDVHLDGVAATLVHSDLINRNVHVDQRSISGIFDWGCMRWGDHLYDLAWFEFWSAWYPDLDIGVLRSELDERWRKVGHRIVARADRERACLLHIGADHLVDNAVIDSPSGLVELLENMQSLDLI